MMVFSYLQCFCNKYTTHKSKHIPLHNYGANIQTFFDIAKLFILFFTKNANNLCLSTPNSPVKKTLPCFCLRLHNILFPKNNTPEYFKPNNIPPIVQTHHVASRKSPTMPYRKRRATARLYGARYYKYHEYVRQHLKLPLP